ncbi:hypothetical protein HHK36_017675 [Tetracentron sinense]|uniref:Uncharacterized protein n=1 Tax=Tetracentron sinense TaxID=13715 RepID=A0A835D9M5_TETSI|nr:hypothetical protein HHK36_017675 [Tetracentron sinense]
MKASLKFRDDQKPLFRAKVPLSILGFPFQSGLAAGDSKELCLNLSTFFQSGPSFKIAYRPNDSWNPFSLLVKTGIGHFGSPISAPMTMSAEFNLIGHGNPSFFLHFKPRLGDFSIKKSAGSQIALSSQPSAIVPKIISQPKDVDFDNEELAEIVETPLANGVNGVFPGRKINCLSPDSPAAYAINSLFSGVEMSARTILPVRNHAVLKARWGVRFPAELTNAFTENGIRVSTAGISLRKIPILSLNKIGIVHVTGDDSKGTIERVPATKIPGNADVAEAYFTVKQQLEDIQAENGLIRKAVEDLRLKICAGKPAWYGGVQDCGNKRELERERNGGKPSGGRNDCRNDKERKSSEYGGGFAGKMTDGDENEELKKALMGATGAGI